MYNHILFLFLIDGKTNKLLVFFFILIFLQLLFDIILNFNYLNP